MLGSFQLRLMAVAMVVIVAPGLLTAPALAVVLPEEITTALDERFDGFIEADGFTEENAASLTGENWYTPARFPHHTPSSAMRPDANIDPVTRSVLLLESREADLPHVRYKITYRMEVASPDYPDVRHAYVEVTRFNLGPTIRKQVVAAQGSENAGPEEVFGVGPHVSWRFVTEPIMGMAANVVRASRKELTGAEVRAAKCLGVSCLSRKAPEGPAGDWQAISPSSVSDPVTYRYADNAIARPARVADYLYSYATLHGEDPAYGDFADPQMTFVISMNVVGQDSTAFGLLHRGNLMDDAVSDIWTRRIQFGAGPEAIEWSELTIGRQAQNGTAGSGQAALVEDESPTNTTPDAAAERAIIVLDGSGSMWGQIEGTPKLEIARGALSQVLSSAPLSLELGLMAYGHREKGNCEDIELLVPPRADAASEIIAAADAMSFLGKTPISEAVLRAADTLRFTEEKATVILITDGIETCNVDPCALARDLEARGIDFTAHVVGFGLSQEEGQQVSCLAEETGGRYLQASNAAELMSAMSETLVVSEIEPQPAPEPETLPSASVEAPAEIPAGSTIDVTWTGPDNHEDYITIVEKGAPEDAYNDYARTSGGSPLEITVPDALGAYEVRYVLDEAERVLASQDVILTPVSASVEAPAEIPAGATIEVAWTGPDNHEDYITIVEKGAPEDAYNDYARTSGGSPLEITVPDALGEYEVRYVIDQSKRVLASQDVTLTPVSASVEAPPEIPAGATIEVAWTGPDNHEDYITIVEKGAPEDAYNDYARTSGGSPAEITVPDALGAYEVRYVISQSKRVLASQDVTLTPVSASVEVLNTPVPGGSVEVAWTGPDNHEDYITIVEEGAPEDAYNDYARTSAGSPVEIAAPDALGEYEVRYVLNQSRRVLASVPVTLADVTASLSAPDSVAAGDAFEVEWTGPANWEDFIEIVPAGAAADTDPLRETRTSQGSPLSIFAPSSPGEYQIRYKMRATGEVAAEVPLFVE